MPEPGLFGIFQRMGGGPDLDAEIAAKLGQAPGQPGGPGPNPLNPPAPGPAGNAPAAAPAAPPTPQAYQSQPDLASLYMQYGRQTQAAQMFNNSLSDMISNFSGIPGGMRSTPAPAGEPAGTLFGNLLKIRDSQQQQQRLANFQAAIPGLVKSMGLDPSYIPIMQNNPELAQGLISGHQPTGIYANWKLGLQDNRERTCPTGDPACVAKADADFQAANPLSSALMPENGSAAQSALTGLHLRAIDFQRRFPGEPLPDYYNNGPEVLAAHDLQTTALAGSQARASGAYPGLAGGLTDVTNKAEDIASHSADVAAILAQSKSWVPNVLNDAREGGWGAKFAQALGITDDQLRLLHEMDDLARTETASMKTGDNQYLQPFVSSLDDNLHKLGNFDVGASNYITAAKAAAETSKNIQAQALGASGQLGELMKNPDLLGRVDNSYLAEGHNYLGDTHPVPPDKLANARAAIAQGKSRILVEKMLRAEGFVPKPGEL